MSLPNCNLVWLVFLWGLDQVVQLNRTVSTGCRGHEIFWTCSKFAPLFQRLQLVSVEFLPSWNEVVTCHQLVLKKFWCFSKCCLNQRQSDNMPTWLWYVSDLPTIWLWVCGPNPDWCQTMLMTWGNLMQTLFQQFLTPHVLDDEVHLICLQCHCNLPSHYMTIDLVEICHDKMSKITKRVISCTKCPGLNGPKCTGLNGKSGIFNGVVSIGTINAQWQILRDWNAQIL